MDRWTEKKLLVALAWIAMDRNNPGKLEHYIMDQTRRVVGMFSKRRQTYETLRVKFSEDLDQRVIDVDPEEDGAPAKPEPHWTDSFIGSVKGRDGKVLKTTYRVVDRDGNLISEEVR